MSLFLDVTAKDRRKAQRAAKSIRRSGQPATLRQISNFGDAWAPEQAVADTTIVVVDLNEQSRDDSGILVGETRRTLLVSTGAGVTITKADKVTLGLTKEQVVPVTRFQEIAKVRPLAPGGTVILWEVDLIT